MPIKFVQVDAFSNRAFYGNPAAVVFDADHLSTAAMQKITQEMNLSETVFLLKPTDPKADYKVRIFTPRKELPFAGHPTVAAAYAVLANYSAKANATLLQQECGLGLIPVEVIPTSDPKSSILQMTQPTPKSCSVDLTRQQVAKCLGCAETDFADTPFETISLGPKWLIVELKSLDTISALKPDLTLITNASEALGADGITVYVNKGKDSDVQVRVRTFAPVQGAAEDPVCGSGNGAVVTHLAKYTFADQTSGSFKLEQGVEIDRHGLIYGSFTKQASGDYTIKIGGEAAVAASGEIYSETL